MRKRIRDYLREQGACCKPSTVAGYRLVLRSFDSHLQKPVTSLSREDLQGYMVRLCERNLVPYTKVNYLLAVKKYLQWEVDRGQLPEDILSVLDRSRLPAVPEYLPRPLSKENDRKLLERLRASDSPCAPLFLLLRHTGMRISEMIHLPPDCVLTGSGDEKYLKVPLGKMNTERLVPLTEESLGLIAKIENNTPDKKRRDQQRLIGLAGSVPRVYAFLTHRFQPFVGDLQDQGKSITFHRLRHTFATTLLEGGVSLVSLMKLLGHRRIEMTLRYAKVTPSHLRDEYLKAIKIIEQQTVVGNPTANHRSPSRYEHPTTLIRHIASFITQNAVLDPLPRKNLLLRLSRLQADLSQIIFSPKSRTNGMGTGARAD